MKKKNCIIIHGCPSNKEKAMDPKTRTYDKHWIPWTKKQLTKLGIKTTVPLMPTPWEPDYQKFKAKLDRYMVNQNTILIGHSCGTAFLVHWLGDTKTKIAKLILVAPWKVSDSKDKTKQEFYLYPIDKTIKNRVKEIIYFTANNEESDGKTSLKIIKQTLGGKTINLKNHGHYTLSDMKTKKFPELIDVMIKPN